jgi:hypothetical protein
VPDHELRKFIYQQKKKQQDSKKKQKTTQVKEVKFRPNIDDHDYTSNRTPEVPGDGDREGDRSSGAAMARRSGRRSSPAARGPRRKGRLM